MAGEVSNDVSTKEMVSSTADNMDTDSVTVPDSEDLLKKEAHVAMPFVTVNEAPNEQGDGSSQQLDVARKGVKLDAESTEGNHEAEEVDVIKEKTVASSLATENPLGDDVQNEAQVDALPEPKADSGIATEVAVAEVVIADNKESFDHNVIENTVEPSLHPCSNIFKQSSSNLSGQKVADMSDTASQVEASMVIGDVVTQDMASLSVPSVQRVGDATAAREMNKETPVKGNEQDELLLLADGDRSTGCDEALSSAPCTEVSAKEIQQSAVKQSDSNLNSTEANYLVLDEESKHLQDPQVTSIPKKDDSFSFDLPNPSGGDTNKDSQPFSTSQDLAISGTVVGSPVAFSSTPKNKRRSQKISQGAKESSEPKRRRSTARKGGKKGDQPDEATLLKQLDREERPTNILTPTGSCFPTLNFSTSHPAAFQQPFTDLQQLQLRAQILVYGSLIQGNAPDEACLISAFGGPDGGRSIWEKPWQKCLERIHNQISQTCMKSHVLQTSGKSTPDQTIKRKHNAPSLGSAGKSDSPHTVNPMVPLPSPFWNIHTSTPEGVQVGEISQASVVDHNPLPPLYPFQSPATNTGHSSPWSSLASRPLPWVTSTQTSQWDPNMSLAVFPNAEPVKLIPVKESSLAPYSTANHSSAELPLSNTAAPAISSEIVGEIQAFKSLGHIAKESKAKKPKKVSVSNDASQKLKPASHSSELVLANTVYNIRRASTKACPLPAANVLTSSSTPLLYSDRISVEDKDAGKKDMASEDALHRVNEAKLHAEEAAACAEAAVSRSQHVWDQLDKQKNSGLTADLESKVASAAAAIAAAASVAKAAAAAAKLASEAALQAKLMAEESLVSVECIKKAVSVNGVVLSDGVNLLDEVTPASILKGENSANISTSIIGAAKEAARRKIESALSASKHAKNLDAIVKAAELAAEAVAQAGRVVAMGDQLPLSALVQSGSEGYWKLSERPPEQLAISNSAKEASFNNEANGGKFGFSKISQDGSLNLQPSQPTNSENQPAPETASLRKINAQTTTADLASASIANEDSNANALVLPELVSEKKSPLSLCHESGNIVETSIDNHMEEGSVVEVFKEWGTVKAAWFAARVLELKDDEVFVSYIEKQTGDGEYKEWITLSSEDNTAPIVRIAHPMTVVPSDGARKRRRSAIGRRSWEVGDKVDAWMQDCWWEGLIIEKNDKDESSLTVQFPAQGETCVVKAWNLRPSLIWKDGAWVQWSNPNESVRSGRKDDTPRGKRQRLSSPQIDVKGKGKASESFDQSILMGLSEHEKKFNVGKTTRDDAKVNAQRMVRTGLREGSKVIFGVPKPGKKRKFMDVGNSNEPRKTSRLPISRGPHGRKKSNSSTEAQQKSSRPKPKDASVTSAPSEVNEGREVDHTVENDSAFGTERQAEPESCSVADEATDDSILISSLARPPNDPSSKRSALGNMKPERANRGKLGLSHVKKADVKVDEVFSRTSQQEDPDAAEPRRSNRRIQPTSRLLEGLQTSLSIAKVPSTVNRK